MDPSIQYTCNVQLYVCCGCVIQCRGIIKKGVNINYNLILGKKLFSYLETLQIITLYFMHHTSIKRFNCFLLGESPGMICGSSVKCF